MIEARGASSASLGGQRRRSTTSATGSLGTPEGDWVSMSVPSDGSYGVEEGLVSGFPCTCSGGEWKLVEGLEIDDFSRERIDTSVNELKEERDAVSSSA